MYENKDKKTNATFRILVHSTTRNPKTQAHIDFS